MVRETRGTSVYCRIAHPDVFALCDLVSGKADLLAARRAIRPYWQRVGEGKNISNKIIVRKKKGEAS